MITDPAELERGMQEVRVYRKFYAEGVTREDAERLASELFTNR